MITQDCVPGGISPYSPTAEKPWDARRIMHLYRRMGFGATYAEINNALALSPADLVDQLIDEAIAIPLAAAPVWANWVRPADYEVNGEDEFGPLSRSHRNETRIQWVKDMVANGFRDKLTLFWSNHFVTEWSNYQCSSFLYQYHRILREYALGNFKDFVYEIGKTPAMLLYLNGNQSTKNNPNENYARELYELFTLGEGNNYTQDDIIETAKALTGFTVSTGTCIDPVFVPSRFHTGMKTIFGQTGIWNYDDVHDILFQERQNEIANHICTKIYRAFVYPDSVDQTIVNALADTFKNNNFELAPVFRQLFKSAHFFDDTFVGTMIKSPVELFLSLVKPGDIEHNDNFVDDILDASKDLQQELFSPPDVAGWQGQRTWINEDLLTKRWDLVADCLINGINANSKAILVQLAKDLTGNSYDPAVISAALIDHFTPNGLQDPNAYAIATEVFKGDIPENYFEDGYWTLDWEEAKDQIIDLLGYLIRLPEFQLT